MSLKYLLLAGLITTLIPIESMARIKLITLPERERVEIQLDHPDVTLVEEERLVPVVKGINQVDFSWANTRIDTSTLVFHVLDQAEKNVRVLSVSYPPGEQALVWNVFAAEAGTVRVKISYILGGLDKHYSYRALASHDEKTLQLSQYLHIKNNANESYDSTQLWASLTNGITKRIGLNESKRLLVNKYKQVPVNKTYTVNVSEYGYANAVKKQLLVPMHYVLGNSVAKQLGKAFLPYGKARLFQEDGAGTSAFLGEDWLQRTPIDDEAQLYIGQARDVVVKRVIERNKRKKVAGNLYNYDLVVKYDIENFKDKAVSLNLVEDLSFLRNEIKGYSDRPVEWQIYKDSSLLALIDDEKTSQKNAVFNIHLPAREQDGKAKKLTHRFHLSIRNEW